jgi:hypothetical protein
MSFKVQQGLPITTFDNATNYPSVSVEGLASFVPKLYHIALSWLKRRRERIAPENQLFVLLKELWIYIDAVDNGVINIECTTVNFSKQAWELDRVEIALWTIEDYRGPSYPHWLTASGSVLSLTTGSFDFSLKLGGPEIRHIVKYMRPAESALAAHGTKVRLQGSAIFRSGKREARIAIVLENRSSNVHLPEHVIKEIRP